MSLTAQAHSILRAFGSCEAGDSHGSALCHETLTGWTRQSPNRPQSSPALRDADGTRGRHLLYHAIAEEV